MQYTGEVSGRMHQPGPITASESAQQQLTFPYDQLEGDEDDASGERGELKRGGKAETSVPRGARFRADVRTVTMIHV